MYATPTAMKASASVSAIPRNIRDRLSDDETDADTGADSGETERERRKLAYDVNV